MAVENYNLGYICDYFCAITKNTYKILAIVNNVINTSVENTSYILNVRRYSKLDA